MAKQLTFKFADRAFALEPIKVDRKKIYGWSEVVVSEPGGAICAAALLNDDGMTVAPSGATKPGMLSDGGEWVSRDELIAVDGNGVELKPVESSFNGEIELGEPMPLNEFLSLNVETVYQLYGEDARTLARIIGRDIYGFEFSYRGGCQASDACILASDGNLFILVGTKVEFPFVGLCEAGVLEYDADEDEVEGELDFGMF